MAMAEDSTKIVFKNFAQGITSSSVNTRCAIFKDLEPCVSTPNFPDGGIKGVLKMLVMTLGRYHDKKSRLLVEEIIIKLASNNFEVVAKGLILVLAETAEFHKKGSNCGSDSTEALAALSWVCAAMRVGYKDGETMKGNDFNQLVELQAMLVYGVMAARKKSISKSCQIQLSDLWRRIPGCVTAYAEAIKMLEPTVYLFPLIRCLIKFLSTRKEHETVQTLKGWFLELYVKQVIGSRVELQPHLLESCKELLRYATHSDFKELLLPAAEKAMLRNPEIALESFKELIAGVSLDLSQYALDIGKHLATLCHAKEEKFHQVATEGCQILAHQCSDSSAIEKVVGHFFGIIGGSAGKLSHAAQRLGLLSGIGRFSYHLVSGVSSIESLSSAVVDMFLSFLQAEGHEGTLIHALSVLSLWCLKFTRNVPEKLIAWFKSSFTQKNFTSPVRSAVIQCMNFTFNGDTLPQCIDILPMLIQTVEKATSLPFQAPLVTEAIHATNLILKVIDVDVQSENKLMSFWNIILDVDKQMLTNDKYLSQAPKDALVAFISIIEKLLTEHSSHLNDKQNRLYAKVLIYILTRPSYEVRSLALAKVKKMNASLGGFQISMTLLQEFKQLLATQKLNTVSSEDVESTKFISPRILADTLATIIAVSKAEADQLRDLAKETLIDAHHPCIVHYCPDQWTNMVYQLHMDVHDFVDGNVDGIFTDFFSCTSLSQSQKNALCTLARVAPDITLPRVVEYVVNVLSNPAFLKVTRDEYALLTWPENELYDKSVIEVSKSEEKQTNMRRENKLYSYQEQMADIELKKELAMKKNLVKEEPKLSKKQQELVQAQLQKEASIRGNLKQLDGQLEKVCSLLLSCSSGSPEHIRLSFPPILACMMPLLKSVLTAPHVSDLFIKLRGAAFSDEHSKLGLLVAHCTLRLLKPECYLPHDWCKEPLASQAERCVNELYIITGSMLGRKGELERPLCAPTFAYSFFLLQSILMQNTFDEGTMLKCLAIITTHARLRTENDDGLDENSPKYLPRELMIRLCVRVIAFNSGRLQQNATDALMETVKCANGEPGSVKAEQREIDAVLDALEAPASAVREAALQALEILLDVLPDVKIDFANGLKVILKMWVAKYDTDEGNKKLAEGLWGDRTLPDKDELFPMLVFVVVHDEASIRSAGAEALAAALAIHRRHIPGVLARLLSLYEEKCYMPPPTVDQFGRITGTAPPDLYPARCGIALAIGHLAPLLLCDSVKALFGFFVSTALRDRHTEVRAEMLKSAILVVNEHGKDNVTEFLPVFEEFLSTAPSEASYDSVRQSVVILMGTLAKHLDIDNPKVKPIVARLIEALSTPSEEVQNAVANCLPPLVPALKQDAPDLVHNLMSLLLESENYGERRGAAYGLAGLIKGLGILALKQLDVMKDLTEAIQDKKNTRHREGALFAFEMLCLMLGRLFEPYVVHLLPHLLMCFGDSNQHIREAADETAKAVMSKLSAHGVKLVLPSLLSALEEDSWRTKCGSVDLLGAMAYCAPKQLSACLPSIVPKLTEVLTDSHIKVQKAGAQALKQIGSVIRNPEIQAVVPILLEALQDPTKKTTMALQKLLETKFVHFIDAPSLALIMPVVQRALADRSTDTRKMAAQIIGNMYSLTDQKDLSPYLPTMIPGLKQSLLDPVPEVRSVSARAFGTMVRGMGEKGIEELVPWLMQTLTSEASTVDRSGAAQGLSEVVGGLGIQKLQSLMPDIIQTAGRTDITPNVRDGYIMMYIYLPAVFGDDFIPYVGPIIPSILKALADETEYVRETALRAGQRIVNQYADTAIELLLPEVEKGLFDDNWRIRCSSVQLMGDLLFRISGVSGKMSTEGADEDDNFGTETSQKAIYASLGPERHNRVFAGLYICRSDTALMVRQAALHVWKVIVTHTPRMLRDILSTLFELLLGCLASQSYDKRQVAARTLGDIVRKLGEKVLPEIIPILEKGLESEDADQRQGVCIGLSEIMSSTSRDHVLVYADSLIPTVRKALCDPLMDVRAAAAKTFDNLHANIGSRALDDILPDLLKKLEDPNISEFALDGLRQVMSVKSRVVLPYLVPQLTAAPVNTRALSFLSSVAGEALTKHLGKILPALMSSLAVKMETEEEAQEMQYCRSVILSVVDEIGIRTTMDELLSATTSSNPKLRYAAVTILHVFCDQSKADYSEYIPQLIRALIHMSVDDNVLVLSVSWDCLNSVTKKIDPADQMQYISHVRQAVRFAVADLKKGTEELPGFSLPKKGIAPIIPIFREGILNGSPEVKESASLGLGEAIRRTSSEALKPSVVNITGPLIRILGDRFNFNVKVAMLETINLLLAKCGPMLKPFLPQLQTTFMKALNDPNRVVRIKSADALGKLVVIHTRVDPLFVELIASVKTADDSSIRDTVIQAVRFCIMSPGCKLTDKVQKDVLQMLEGYLTSTDDSTRIAAAACLGTLCRILDGDILSTVIASDLLDVDTSPDWAINHGRSIALSTALKESSERILTPDLQGKVKKALISFATADRIPVCTNGLRGIAYWMKSQISTGSPIDMDLVAALVKAMKSDSNDVKQLVAQIITFLSKSSGEKSLDDGLQKAIVPMLVMGTKEKNAAVKSFSEHALVTLLRLRKDDSGLQACIELLESGMKESLTEVVNKVLRKLATQPETPDEDIDNTILK